MNRCIHCNRKYTPTDVCSFCQAADDAAPKPEEISRMCDEIRAGWSAKEAKKRYVGSRKPMETPLVRVWSA